MMKPPILILSHILVMLFAGHVHLQSANIQHKRATGIVGGEVQINCEVEYGPFYEMSWDFNKIFVYIITLVGENYPLDTNKYFVHRTRMNFTLIIKDLSLEDGGEYTCTSYTAEATAFLVVLDTPSITMNPPTPVDGETAKVTCEARFGGPRIDLILPDHHPNLKMYLNESSPNETVTANDTSVVKKYYLISMTESLTVHASMHTRHITCEIGTAEPIINTSTVAVLNVLYSVRDIHITPNQERYKVGDNISCIADSNPAAIIEWKKVQGGSTMYAKHLKITDSMIGENNWECVARNLIKGEWFQEIVQSKFVAVDPIYGNDSSVVTIAVDPSTSDGSAVTIAVDPFKSGNDRSPVTIAVVTVTIIILVIIAAAAFIFVKNLLKKRYLKRSRTKAMNLQKLISDETESLLTKNKKSLVGILLRLVKDKQELDEYGKLIHRVLKEDGVSIVKKEPKILIRLVKKAGNLIDSEYYEDIIKAVPYGGDDSPLKYLLGILNSGEENFKQLFKDQKKLMSLIQTILSHGNVQYRTQCLKYIIITWTFGDSEYSFEWSEEYLSTVKDLLDKGADPTWISPEELEKYRYDRSTAQNGFFGKIFDNLWEKNDLHESLLGVFPLMLSKKSNNYQLLPRTLLHEFVGDSNRWDYIATNRESMPPDFFRQFQNILREILRRDGTLPVQKDWYGRTPLQLFLDRIHLEESIFGEVREIIQMLQTPQVLSSKGNSGWTALHYLALFFPVIRGEVTQSGRESFLELVKSFANESNVGCQDIWGRTALHYLAKKFPGGISEEWREVYQDFVKHLASYDILEIEDNYGDTALRRLADRFTFEIEDGKRKTFEIEEWRMETFVEVLKCLAVPRTICIKDKETYRTYGETALEIITRKWGDKVPEHYKDKFKEISDILSGNN